MILKKILFSIFVSLIAVSAWSQAIQVKSSKASAKKTSKKKNTPVASVKENSKKTQLPPALAAQLSQALRLVQSGQCQQAIPLLFSMTRKSEFDHEKMQIKYILGNCLIDVGLNQIAAFELVEVIKHGGNRYVRQAIEKLSIAADALGDDTLLNYAVTKIKIDEIPANGKDLIYFRLGEVKMKAGQYSQAVDLFNKVTDSSRYYFLSRYQKGLAYLEMKHPQDAIQLFKALSTYRSTAAVTDTNRAIAKLGLARAYYQAQDWDNSIAAYREIPRDHFLWHDALFESSWAMLRGARFRSALSNFHSLHSSYYQDFFIPESLLVRSIVYLYICKYDEMEKVLELFDHSYGPVDKEMSAFLNRVKDPQAYYQEIEAAFNYKNNKTQVKPKLPIVVLYHIMREGDVKRSLGYLKALNDERLRLDQMSNIARSAIGAKAKKIIANRFKNARLTVGELTKAHMLNMKAELRDLNEQASFIKYEMINGKKEQLKKKIAGKDIPGQLLNEEIDRNMYVQNGYEYWPFDGEFWLDEIGNYHYLGKQNCE